MRTKKQAAKELFITSDKLRRLCKTYHMELVKLKYKVNSNHINDACFDFLNEKSKIYEEDNVYVIFKSKFAKKYGLHPNTLANWIHEPETFKKLAAQGYEKLQRKLTQKQIDIIEADHM